MVFNGPALRHSLWVGVTWHALELVEVGSRQGEMHQNAAVAPKLRVQTKSLLRSEIP